MLSKPIGIRLTPDERCLIDKIVNLRGYPWTLSMYIREAIKARLKEDSNAK